MQYWTGFMNSFFIKSVISRNKPDENIVCTKSVESFKSDLQHRQYVLSLSRRVKARFGIVDVKDTDTLCSYLSLDWEYLQCHRNLSTKLLSQGFLKYRLILYFKTFSWRYKQLVEKYRVTFAQMKTFASRSINTKHKSFRVI
jgi:hypothetical protein